MSDLISRQAAIDATWRETGYTDPINVATAIRDRIEALPSTRPELIRCKDCKHWNQATAFHGGALSFGFCESDDMWRSLYGETTEVAHIDTDDDFFCGYAERQEE